MNFIKVDSVELADFWIPEYDNHFKYHGIKRIYKLLRCKLLGETFNDDIAVTVGKPYKLSISKHDQEYVIIDDNGQQNNIWIIHAGYFAKEIK